MSGLLIGLCREHDWRNLTRAERCHGVYNHVKKKHQSLQLSNASGASTIRDTPAILSLQLSVSSLSSGCHAAGLSTRLVRTWPLLRAKNLLVAQRVDSEVHLVVCRAFEVGHLELEKGDTWPRARDDQRMHCVEAAPVSWVPAPLQLLLAPTQEATLR